MTRQEKIEQLERQFAMLRESSEYFNFQNGSFITDGNSVGIIFEDNDFDEYGEINYLVDILDPDYREFYIEACYSYEDLISGNFKVISREEAREIWNKSFDEMFGN